MWVMGMPYTEIEGVYEELRKVLGEIPILAAEQVRATRIHSFI